MSEVLKNLLVSYMVAEWDWIEEDITDADIQSFYDDGIRIWQNDERLEQILSDFLLGKVDEEILHG